MAAATEEETSMMAKSAGAAAGKKQSKSSRKKKHNAPHLMVDSGYVSGSLGENSQGGCYPGFSQMTNNSSGYEDDPASFPEEDSFSALLQDQRLSDPTSDIFSSRKLAKDRPRDRGPAATGTFVSMLRHHQSGTGPAAAAAAAAAAGGHNQVIHHHHRHHQQQIQSPQASKMANLSPASQQNYHATNHHGGVFGGSGNAASNGSSNGNNNGPGSNFFATNDPAHAKTLTASSGYCSFGSTSPKVGKCPDDVDGSSVISSSHRSNLTSSFSTFSSHSSRVSSPCSNSDPLKMYHTLSPAGVFPSGQMVGSQCGATSNSLGGVSDGSGYLKHTLRFNNSYVHHSNNHSHSQPQPHPGSLHPQHVRRHSDEMSSAATRPWVHSSQSSRYSYSGSELSDDLLENLPTTYRRDSFSKNQSLPLPDSMQQNLGMGTEYENGTSFSQSQNGFMGPDATIPLSHFNNAFGSGSGTQDRVAGSFNSQERHCNSQDRVFSQDGQYTGDMYPPNLIHSQSSSSNMVIGDMESFASTFSEEADYFNMLHASSQVK